MASFFSFSISVSEDSSDELSLRNVNFFTWVFVSPLNSELYRKMLSSSAPKMRNFDETDVVLFRQIGFRLLYAKFIKFCHCFISFSVPNLIPTSLQFCQSSVEFRETMYLSVFESFISKFLTFQLCWYTFFDGFEH